jgi:hypothetical protein
MLEVLMGIALPPAIFGVFALLAVWLGAESRPWFDERPVLDDRPNWWPIVRRLPRDAADSADRDEPLDGLPEPAAEPVVVRQRRPVASTRPATSPSGV